MRQIAIALAVAAAMPAGPAHAEVTARGPEGFVISLKVTLPVEHDKAWAAFMALPSWWDPAHTYTGDALNLSLDPRVGGCWCERIPPEGAVEHMRVTYIHTNEAIRFSGGLGPLAEMGAHGAMTVKFVPMADGMSRVEMTYAVSGFLPGLDGIGAVADPVDRVLGEAMARFESVVRAQLPGEEEATP